LLCDTADLPMLHARAAMPLAGATGSGVILFTAAMDFSLAASLPGSAAGELVSCAWAASLAAAAAALPVLDARAAMPLAGATRSGVILFTAAADLGLAASLPGSVAGEPVSCAWAASLAAAAAALPVLRARAAMPFLGGADSVSTPLALAA